MADWADLMSVTRRTKGDCPPPLVGASVTLVGDSIYVFGGRPVHSREMVNTLYALHLRSLTWAKLWPAAAAARGPAPRYFHSAQAWGDKLVVFGGQSFVASIGAPGSPDALETLDELVVFDTRTLAWSFPSPSLRAGVSRPSPRYAHLAVVTTTASRPSPGFQHDPATHASRLVVIGGQDIENNYLADLAVLDLDAMEWIAEAPYPRKAGTYRSVAAAAPLSVRPLEERINSEGAWFAHSAHAVEPTEDREEPVWVYSNSNFASPRRDLDLIPTVHASLSRPAYVSVADAMQGDPALPPGLRFPHAYLCGSHLVVSGAHVGVNRAEYVVWTLDLGAHDPAAPGKGALVWTPLPLQKALGRGSWGPALGWRNTLVVVGDAGRNLSEDYNARQSTQTNFAEVAFVDLEGFGIYVPPAQSMLPAQQLLGLMTMSQPQLSDFEIICSDRERLGCSRKVLEARWPWFADELPNVEAKANAAIEAREQRTTTSSGSYGDSSDEELVDGVLSRVASPKQSIQQVSPPARTPSRLFPITPRSLELPLPSSDVKAILQYFQTLALSTSLQRSLPVLTSLLAFTNTYDSVLPSLRALVVHALHETLSTQPDAAPKVYEAAALGDSVALQIRAMQVMLYPRRGSTSSVQSIELRRNANSAEPSRTSDQSQGAPSPLTARPRGSADSPSAWTHAVSTDLSAYSGFEKGSDQLDYRTSAGSTGTPASSVLRSPTACYQPSMSPVPPLPHHGSPSAFDPSVSPNLSLPLVSGSPFFNSDPAARGPASLALPACSASLSAAVPASAHPAPAPVWRASSSATPTRIADAWREGEERDAAQRAAAARIAAEAERTRSTAVVDALRLVGVGGAGEPNASVAHALALGSITEAVPLGPPLHAVPDGGYGGAIDEVTASGDAASVQTGRSARYSSEKAVAAVAVAAARGAAETTAKAVKKGLFSGFLGPTIHNAGTSKKAPPATGPAPKRAYPRPTPRTAKGAQALARLDDQFEQASTSAGSFAASFHS
ncbi:hypothetical protein JCM3770_005306 [Rhodotorula araucariae]